MPELPAAKRIDKIVPVVARLIDADGRGGVGVDVRAPAIGVDARAVVVVRC